MKPSLTLMLAAGLAAVTVSCRTPLQQMPQEQPQDAAMSHAVDEYLIAGDAQALDAIKTGGRSGAEALESAILATNAMSPAEYERAVRGLGAVRRSSRMLAVRRLQLAQTNILAEVEQDLLTTKRENVIAGLQAVRGSLRMRGQRLTTFRELMPALYGSVAETLLPERLAALRANPGDPRAVMFFTQTPYAVLTPLMAHDDPKGWGLYCLLLFHEHSGPALSFEQSGRTILVDDLGQLSGDDLLQEVGKLWPVELQPFHQSGSYFWTIRAAEKTTSNACNVVRMSVDRSQSRPVIVHLYPFKEVRFSEAGIEQYIRWDGSTIGTPGRVWDSWVKKTE